MVELPERVARIEALAEEWQRQQAAIHESQQRLWTTLDVMGREISRLAATTSGACDAHRDRDARVVSDLEELKDTMKAHCAEGSGWMRQVIDRGLSAAAFILGGLALWAASKGWKQ